ncbi:MAG TPA: iron-containing alcohol dehydrogenase [Acidimicrobiales bacterium]|nr:iron-containing alcohol dehydrogenase [Acidimicrobiales bacterium]
MHSGIGCVRDGLAPDLHAQSVERPLVVCGANVARSDALRLVRDVLGEDVRLYDGSQPHTPVESVDRGAAVARAAKADGLIALGGSSAVDCAKGIAVLLATGARSVTQLQPATFGRLSEQPEARADAPVPVVALTTTLSFAELLPFWGARHADTVRKVPYTDHGRVTRTVFLDGELASTTPDRVWAETGVKALDDAISAFCRSDRPEPFLDPILVTAMVALVDALDVSDVDRRIARQQALTATWMTKTALPRLEPVTVPAWFSTTARHALGAVAALPHGVGSCVALPHALAFHAGVTAPRQAELARALAWHDGLAPGLTAWLHRLGVPRRLGPLGIEPDLLDLVVARMLDEAPTLGTHATLRRACTAFWQEKDER